MFFKRVCILIAAIITGLTYSGSGYAAVGDDFNVKVNDSLQTQEDVVEQIAAFEFSTGVTYLLDGWHQIDVLHWSGNSVKIDETGDLHIAYGNYNTVRYAIVKTDNSVESYLVDTVSKKMVRPSLARNERGYYISSEEWDRLPTYNSYNDSRLYHKPFGENWLKLQDVQLNVHSEAGGAKDIFYSIKEAPDGNIHLLYCRWGWWSYGWAHHQQVLDKNTHQLSGLNVLSARRSSHPDEGRNNDFKGSYYIGNDNQIVMPLGDNQSQVVFLAEAASPDYSQWVDKGNLISTGKTWRNGIWQDSDGNVHAVFSNNSTNGARYCLNWGQLVEVSNIPAYGVDIAVFEGTIYILFSHRDPAKNNCQGNLYMVTKPIDGTQWSEPRQVTFETSDYKGHYITNFFFARPFGYKQDAARLCFAYIPYDGVASGNDYLNAHIKVVEISKPTVTVTFTANEHCRILDSGAAAVQSVAPGGSAAAPDVETDEGYYFMGWDVSFDNITSDITVTAVTRERFNGKDGVNEPLEILLAEELEYISDNSEYWNLDAALKGNIDLGGRFMLPIGNIEQPFNAEFNGCGYVISNLQLAFCYSPAKGLFGIVGTNGIVKNLGVDANILAARYLNFDSGIIAGQNQGIIRCCWTSGKVAGYITAGGMAGYNVGIISNSYSMAGCSAYFAGGLVGENGGTISNCYTSTTIASIDNRTIEGCRILEPATPYILETFGWDTVNNNEDGQMDYWFQEENRLPLLFWQALRGDANYDGTADMQDLMILADWWLLSDDAIDEGIRLRGDINLDGRVDMLDFVEIVKAVSIDN